MEGIGRLAGGIAHDFNNLLTAIIGFTELAKESIPPEDAVQDYLDSIAKASERAAALTAQLLTFARKQVIPPQIVNVNALILDIGKMLERIIGGNIELVLLPMPDVKQVRIDPGQLGQVLVNLVVNARDAMPAGGKVTIETSSVTVDQEYADQHGELTPGTYALLAVTDTGTGISEEALPHLFEPFFTTKNPGKGTGMGLATCYGIVKQGGGCIQIANLTPTGTTVQIFLPQIEEPTTQRPQETGSLSLQGTEVILLVEDEPMVREVGASLLRQRGYTVIEAANGPEAIRLIHDYPGKIDLMLTDMVMPQMSGMELAARVRVSNPQIKILHTSGYTGNTLSGHAGHDPDFMFLQKPFASADLAKKVREVLGKRAP
jgi:CheY-like chemotaxis protein